MNVYEIFTRDVIKIMGIITWSLFFITLLIGIIRKPFAKLFRKSYRSVHMIIASIAMTLATVHGLIIIIWY
jgi:hypothetical protein